MSTMKEGLMKKMINIYTDGSSKGNGTNGARGGWAYLALIDNLPLKKDAGAQLKATNQQMELLAAYYALEELEKTHPEYEKIIYSDSAYLINCQKDGWWKKWEWNGWVNSRKLPVKNKEIWELLIPFFKDSRIKWVKVKGHSGNKYNEIVDDMAQEAAENCPF